MIQPKHSDFVISYADQTIDNVFTLENQHVKAEPSYNDDVFQVGNAALWIDELRALDIKDSLLISVENLVDDAAITFMQELAKKGVRTFLLLNDATDNQKCIEALAGQCCIRTGVQQAGMLIIADHQKDQREYGRIYSSAFSSNASSPDIFAYSMALEAKQVDDYYRLFCKLFWQHASHEYLSSAKAFACKEAPLAMIDTAHQNIMHEYLMGHLEQAISGAGATGCFLSNMSENNDALLWQLLDFEDAELVDGSMLLSLEQATPRLLNKLISQVEDIQLIDQPVMPQLFLSQDEQWFLPLKNVQSSNESISVSWVLKLTDDQRQSVEDYQFELQDREKWLLNKQLYVRDLNTALRFADDIDQQVECLEESRIDLKSLECADYQEFEDKSAEELAKGLIGFKRSNLAKATRYQIEIQPPYLATNKEDSLHGQWNDARSLWSAEVARLKARNTRVETSRESLSDSIKSYMKSFLNVASNSKRSLDKKLVELEEVNLASLSPSHRKKSLSVINMLAEELLSSEEKLANQTDIAEQQKFWQEQKDKLIVNVEKAKKEVDTTKTALDSFILAKSTKQQEIIQNLTDKWKSWVNGTVGLLEKPELVNLDSVAIISWYQKNAEKLSDTLQGPDTRTVDVKLVEGWAKLLKQHKENKSLPESLSGLSLSNAEDIRALMSDKSKPEFDKSIKKSIDKLFKADEYEHKQAANALASQIKTIKQTLRKITDDYEQKNKGLKREEDQLVQQSEQALRDQKGLSEDLGAHENKYSRIKPKNAANILAKLFGNNSDKTVDIFHIDFPNEELPQVGHLYNQQAKRYLAISQENEVEQGKACAQRLKAELVVNKKVVNQECV